MATDQPHWRYQKAGFWHLSAKSGLAAKILSDFAAIEAVETLERIGMQTDEPNNPFTLAAEQIIQNFNPLPEPNYIEDGNFVNDVADINDVMDINLPDVNSSKSISENEDLNSVPTSSISLPL